MKNVRRVVIAGLGVASPVGIGKNAVWPNLIASTSSVDHVTAFNPSA